jgi:hypothetical protein
MTFRKRTARGKTLLQKGLPPGPSFRKLPNDYGEVLGRRRIRLAAHKLNDIEHYRSSLQGWGRFSCKKEPPGLLAEQQKQST